MLIISHRGNLEGRDPATENTVEQVQKALDLGFDVEVDVWWVNGDFFLGHDTPENQVMAEWLAHEHLWCHAKNLDALTEMLKWRTKMPSRIRCFWHERDKFTITSTDTYIWTAIRTTVGQKVVVVTNDLVDLTKVAGVCTDCPIATRDAL